MNRRFGLVVFSFVFFASVGRAEQKVSLEVGNCFKKEDGKGVYLSANTLWYSYLIDGFFTGREWETMSGHLHGGSSSAHPHKVEEFKLAGLTYASWFFNGGGRASFHVSQTEKSALNFTREKNSIKWELRDKESCDALLTRMHKVHKSTANIHRDSYYRTGMEEAGVTWNVVTENHETKCAVEFFLSADGFEKAQKCFE